MIRRSTAKGRRSALSAATLTSLVAPFSCATVLLSTACGGDERVSPVGGGGGGDATSSASSTSAATASGSTAEATTSTGGGPILRTVLERNPFGAQVGNLLADGDFELSFGFPGQQGWVAFSSSGAQGVLVAETGGLCRSGLRCARVAPGGLLFARGTSAAGQADMRVTLWARPATTPDCSGVFAQVISCDSFTTKGNLIRSVAPDQDGWCSYGLDIVGATIATCLYVENNTEQDMIFDDGSLVALPPDAAPRPAPKPVVEVPAATRARMDRVRQRLRDTLPIGPPPVLPPGATPLPGRTYAEPLDLGP